jgi:plastocyanin
MQHPVHNRATIRVADRTDVSGRVTADEVNLDRFHNRIRKVCALVAATLIPSSLRWMLLFAVLIVPQVLWGAASAPATPQPTPQTWFATVGAQSNDQGGQALAFLPNEIWIHEGDSITWTFDAGEIHTVTFLKNGQDRPSLADGCPGFTTENSGSFDGTACLTTGPLVKGANFTVTFPAAGNFKVLCLVHENMTGAIHVLNASEPLPHDQHFYDRQAADQSRDLLSDTDGDHNRDRHQDCNHEAHLVTAGIGETSATAAGAEGSSVFRFKDDKIEIHAGQTVEWNNQDPVVPHTITFGTEPPPNDLFPPSSNVTVEPDGALHADISSTADNVHSGFIIAAPLERVGNPSPLGTTRFRVTFLKPGVFRYICALHDDLGMKGMVIVFPKVPPQ